MHREVSQCIAATKPTVERGCADLSRVLRGDVSRTRCSDFRLTCPSKFPRHLKRPWPFPQPPGLSTYLRSSTSTGIQWIRPGSEHINCALTPDDNLTRQASAFS